MDAFGRAVIAARLAALVRLSRLRARRVLQLPINEDANPALRQEAETRARRTAFDLAVDVE
jgi:hypothetical protein